MERIAVHLFRASALTRLRIANQIRILHSTIRVRFPLALALAFRVIRDQHRRFVIHRRGLAIKADYAHLVKFDQVLSNRHTVFICWTAAITAVDVYAWRESELS